MGGDVREQALQRLAETLRGSLTTEGLREWTYADPETRGELLNGRIFGTIRWSTSVGRPLGPSLAAGFRIVHRYHELDWKVTAGGQTIDTGQWCDGSPPSLWDRPGDEDHYEVGFVCWGRNPWENSVRVELVEDEPWDTPLQLELQSTFRVVVPELQVIVLSDAPFAVLDPVTVEERPIRRF
jgi:hypothetical protein